MSNLIDRQAAIDAILEQTVCATKRELVERCDTNISDENGWLGGVCIALDTIEDLPSAQPEIIRCTECKHYREYDSKYVENAVVVQCMADRYPISETIPDGWFCAGAERKDDE
jgi:hypothetical protein